MLSLPSRSHPKKQNRAVYTKELTHLENHSLSNSLIIKYLVEAAGAELFWVLTTRNLLIPGTATTARRARLPDPLYVYCTKILFALESDRQTEQSRVHANSALSTSMVFTRRRQAQSPLPLDRAHGKSFVLPSRLSLPRPLAQD
jgi:hypothetical protein